MLLFVASLYFLGDQYAIQNQGTKQIIIGSALQFLVAIASLIYCGFAAIHAVQHIESPRERATYMILTVGFNIVGSCVYYCTKYQTFRKEGKGALILNA